MGDRLATRQRETSEDARGAAAQRDCLLDVRWLATCQQQGRARKHTARPPDQVVLRGKLFFGPDEPVQRVLDQAESAALSRQIEQRACVLVVQAHFLGESQLLVTGRAGFVKKVGRQVRVGQVQAGGDRSGTLRRLSKTSAAPRSRSMAAP